MNDTFRLFCEKITAGYEKGKVHQCSEIIESPQI
jgi:hypothetical protein